MGEVVQNVVAQAGGGDVANMFLMMGVMFAIVYFMLIRPQRKQQQEHQSLLSALKKGDEVVLSSGVFGKVHAVEERVVVVEIAEKTRVKVLKSAVSGLANKALAQGGGDAEKNSGK